MRALQKQHSTNKVFSNHLEERWLKPLDSIIVEFTTLSTQDSEDLENWRAMAIAAEKQLVNSQTSTIAAGVITELPLPHEPDCDDTIQMTTAQTITTSNILERIAQNEQDYGEDDNDYIDGRGETTPSIITNATIRRSVRLSRMSRSLIDFIASEQQTD